MDDVSADGAGTRHSADLPSQRGDVGPTPLVDRGAPGMYRVSVYVRTIKPANAKLTVRIGWNDGTPQSRDVVAGFDLSSANRTKDAQVTLSLADSQSITYQTLGAGAAARYRLSLRVEPL